MLLQRLPNRANIELRIAQKAQQQFHRAIARTASHPADGSIDAVGPVDDPLDRVREGQLLIVMRVNTDFLARPL